jgi:hypothetical protein
VVLRRNRWNAALWLTETVLEVFAGICLYVVLYEPLLGRAVPALAEVIVIVSALITLVSRGSTLVRLWRYPV